MANYDLTQLIGWTRRSGGDPITVVQESVTADGVSQRFTLQNDGYINVTELDIDNVAQDLSTISFNIAQFTLPSIPLSGSTIDVTYNNARYADEDILACIIDAAMVVQADVKQQWTVDIGGSQIVDGTQPPPPTPGTIPYDIIAMVDPRHDLFFNAAGNADPTLIKLIVYRAAVSIYILKAFAASDNAILIKDGDTSINTALTAKSTDVTFKRLSDLYAADLLRYRTEHFMGAAQGDSYCPFNILVKHRDDGTVFLYNW